MTNTCSNCGKSREDLIKETGRAFDIVGLHESKDWQVCNVACMNEFVIRSTQG